MEHETDQEQELIWYKSSSLSSLNSVHNINQALKL